MIRFMLRWAFRLFVLGLCLGVALILCKDTLLKAFAETQIRTRTGMDVKLGKLEVGLFTPTVSVEDFKLYNPAEFGGSPFVEVPDLFMEYDPAALARLRLQLRLVRIAVTELNVVEARNGMTNLVLALEDVEPSASRGDSNFGSLFGFAFGGIDILNLTLGTVRFTSLRQPSKSTEVKLGLRNEILTGVKSTAELKRVLMKTLLRNGITIVTDGPAVERSRRTTPKAATARR